MWIYSWNHGLCSNRSWIVKTRKILTANIIWRSLPHSQYNVWIYERGLQNTSFLLQIQMQNPINPLSSQVCKYWSVSEIHLWHSQIIAALCSILLFCFSNILPDYVFCENKYIFLWLLMLQSFTRTETPFQGKLEKVVCLSKSNSKTNLL